MDEYKKQMRRFGMVATIGIWGVIGIISLLKIVKSFTTGHELETIELMLLLAALTTVAGVLSGDYVRRLVGFLWLTVAALGLLAFIFGAGLDIKWMLDSSMGLLFTGLITAQFIFLPDHN